jgi:hypothetical protein
MIMSRRGKKSMRARAADQWSWLNEFHINEKNHWKYHTRYDGTAGTF